MWHWARTFCGTPLRAVGALVILLFLVSLVSLPAFYWVINRLGAAAQHLLHIIVHAVEPFFGPLLLICIIWYFFRKRLR